MLQWKRRLEGAEQIGFTILSLTVSLIAVLIPLLFMGDVVGRITSARLSCNARRHDRHFGGSVIHAYAHDERAHLAATSPRNNKAVFTRFPSMLSTDDRVLRAHVKFVLRFQTITLFVAVATLLLTFFFT